MQITAEGASGKFKCTTQALREDSESIIPPSGEKRFQRNVRTSSFPRSSLQHSSPGKRKCERSATEAACGDLISNAKRVQLKTNKHTTRGLHPVHTSAATAAAAAADNVRG